MRTTEEFDDILDELSSRMKLPRSRVVEKLVQDKLDELKRIEKEANQ